MRTLEEIKRTVETGLGRFPCELKLANVQLVNVFSGEIYPTDIYIQNKRVVSIEPGLTLEAEKNVDCGGAYAVPGLLTRTCILSPPCSRRRRWPLWLFRREQPRCAPI